MKRQLLQMEDPVFGPGEVKTAKAPITVSPAGLACEAELFLGPNESTKVATSGIVTFISTGLQQQVGLPVSMPAGGAIYHVYLDLYAGGYLLAAFQATEDVTIPSGSVGPITWE